MKHNLRFAIIFLLAALGIAAVTKVNINQVRAVASAGTVYSGPLTGTAAQASFKPFTTLLGVIPQPNTGRWTLFQQTGAAQTTVGDASTSAGTVSNGVADSTNPPWAQWATNTTNGNVASNNGNTNYVVGRNLLYQVFHKPSATAGRREWIVLTDQTAATMAAADDPAGNWAGFTFCSDTGAGCTVDNTNWQWATKDNATKNSGDTGIAFDANYHRFEIVETAGVQFDFYIDGVLVGTSVANLPTTATPLRFATTATCVNCTPTAQNFRRGWLYVESDF